MRSLRSVASCVVMVVLGGCQLPVAVVGERGSASGVTGVSTGEAETTSNPSAGSASGDTGGTGGFATTSDSAATTEFDGDTTGLDVGGSTFTTGFGSTDGTGFGSTEATGPFGESTMGIETDGTTMDPGAGSGGSSG